ncbi:MAG: alpha-amylase, partial [Acidobacteria bacterium]
RSIGGPNTDILHQSDANRITSFKRWSRAEEVIIVVSLNNTAFSNGYVIEKDALAIPGGLWKEVFNSDAAIYGGWNVGNQSAILASSPGRFNVVVPAAGFLVFVKQ